MFDTTLSALWVGAIISTIYFLWLKEKGVAEGIFMMCMWLFVSLGGANVQAAGLDSATTTDLLSILGGAVMFFLSIIFVIFAVFGEAEKLLK